MAMRLRVEVDWAAARYAIGADTADGAIVSGVTPSEKSLVAKLPTGTNDPSIAVMFNPQKA